MAFATLPPPTSGGSLSPSAWWAVSLAFAHTIPTAVVQRVVAGPIRAT